VEGPLPQHHYNIEIMLKAVVKHEPTTWTRGVAGSNFRRVAGKSAPAEQGLREVGLERG
jgi:hypothetical protein